MSSFIPYGRQQITDGDIQAVVDVLKSDFLTQGPAIPRFERAVASHVGAEYAVAVANATGALHIACLAAGLGAGDWLWTTPNTFVASANCGLYCGARVDFVDIDPVTYNMSTVRLREKLAVAKRSGALPKVVVAVAFAGQSCEMDQISQLSKEYGFTLIEDASHAVGATYKQSKVGCGLYADMTIFSFHPVKIVTTGEGGIVLTNRRDLFDRLQILRTHGITRDPAQMTKKTEGGWYYQQIALGLNYRMTDIQAALGTSQFARIDAFLARRRALAARYAEKLRDLPVVLPREHADCSSAYHLYVIQVDDRAEVYRKMASQQIGVNVHYIPVHLQPHYEKMGFKRGDFPVAEAYYAKALTLPLHAGLTDEEQDRVVSALKI